jgi:uncharacterized caspase-like protein
MLVAFATAPGKVALDGAGDNSPFTTALLALIASPGLEIRQMLTRVRADVAAATQNRQIPWDNSSLFGDVVAKLASAEETKPNLPVGLRPSPFFSNCRRPFHRRACEGSTIIR